MSGASASDNDSNCLFCRIVAREIEADIIFADGDVVAFRDIAPQAPTHILVVPTHHLADAASITHDDGELLAHLMVAATSIAEQEGLARGYRLVFNMGEDAGNTVSHLHLHLLGGRELAWPPG